MRWTWLQRTCLIACTITLWLPVGVGADASAETPARAFNVLYEDVEDNRKPLRSELVGLVIDERDTGALLIYRDDGEILLPMPELFQRLDIEVDVVDGQPRLATPGGSVDVEWQYFVRIHGAPYFIASLLDERLAIVWAYSKTNVAIQMTLPWWGSRTSARGKDDVAPDFKPSSFLLTQARFDHIRSYDDRFETSANELLLRGRLADGTWQAEIFQGERRDTMAEDYYWIRDAKHQQLLVGNQRVSMHPLLPNFETTGLQRLYNSKDIAFDPYNDQTRSQYIRHSGLPVQDLKGTARPGAIAELRVDGRRAQRVRVRLDGTYKFERVNLPTLRFVAIEVYILDQRTRRQIAVHDFSRTPIDLMLEKGQTVLFTGAGFRGNPLTPDWESGDDTFFGLARYGITDRLTVEAGAQSIGSANHAMVGLTGFLNRRWTGSVSYADHKGSSAYASELFGRGARWQFNARSQTFDDGFRTDASPRTSWHDVLFDYRATAALRVGAYGRVVDSMNNDDSFVLPGLYWQVNSHSFARVWPNSTGEYRANLRTYLRDQDWFEYTYEDDLHRGEYHHSRTENLELFARLEDRRESETLAEMGFVYYPREFDDRSFLQGSVLTSGSGFGYRLRWETPVLPGFYSQLELRNEPRSTEFFDRGLQIHWRLTLDFSFAGGRPVPARNSLNHSRTGAIGGRLSLADGSKLSDANIEKVEVLVDGIGRVAQVTGDYFFLQRLKPGTYQISLGTEHLPMSLTPMPATYRVEVAPTATTKVDFVLRAEYGIGGQITHDVDEPAAGVSVEVFNAEGVQVARTRADRYGYYRVSGLVPGRYTIRAGDHYRLVDVTDAFVMDADLVMAE
ncbi:MAG: carboxypeptidase-like regulatory domain-containing protein [Gammaproteobacteria bacterium]|nr:carboxypeptidase-like regulatory domain-containing protein [Gammaproteobacteria bacterium]